MKYFDEFEVKFPETKRFRSTLERYEKITGIDLDSIDDSAKFAEFNKWLQDNYSTTSGYQRRAVAKRYLDYVSEKIGRATFEAIKMNLAVNRYIDDGEYGKNTCQYLFFDDMMEFINGKISDYIDSKVEPGQPSDLLWDGFVYHRAIYSLIWNGYHPNEIPMIKISDIDFDKHTINGKIINKGWNYISTLANQKTFYVMRGKGKVVESSYHGTVYLFRHRTPVEGNKKYNPITKDELRSIMTGFQNNVLDSEFAHATEIMYNGAISNFFKTDAAHGTSVAIANDLIQFTENYCVGYTKLPSKKMMYEHFELYKKNLLKYLMEKYNVTDLL